MHKLAQWSVRNGEVSLVLTGWNAEGVQEAVPVSEVCGPDESRICAPEATIAWQLNGPPIELVPDFAGFIV